MMDIKWTEIFTDVNNDQLILRFKSMTVSVEPYKRQQSNPTLQLLISSPPHFFIEKSRDHTNWNIPLQFVDQWKTNHYIIDMNTLVDILCSTIVNCCTTRGRGGLSEKDTKAGIPPQLQIYHNQ